MENSAEMTASLENKLFLNDPPTQPLPAPTLQTSSLYPQLTAAHQNDELYDSSVQEFGTDAIEGENGEYQWEEGKES